MIIWGSRRKTKLSRVARNAANIRRWGRFRGGNRQLATELFVRKWSPHWRYP